MEAQAITRHIRQSPRKIKVVLDEIRGAKFEVALNYLHFSKAKAASQIEKTLRSAYHNLIVEAKDLTVKTENLFVKECFANGGPHMKRFRAASMGRISRLNKPTAHITIVVSDKKDQGERFWDKKHIQLVLDCKLIRIGDQPGFQVRVLLLDLKKI